MQILGIDPGIRNTGWGVVSAVDGRLTHVANGVIQPDSKAPDSSRPVSYTHLTLPTNREV